MPLSQDTLLPDGVLLIDKPTGMSSFDVVRRLRPILKTKKIGHTGTLDPFASGLLVMVCGTFTRLADNIVAQTKAYEAELCFDGETNTDDPEGEQTVPGVRIPSIDELRGVLPKFVGDIEQVPPMFSAIKKDGERLYKKARRGEVLDLPPRPVRIEAIEAREDGGRLLLDVVCGKGTYIRALARDIGRALGCPAHLKNLRRTAVGAYSVDEAAVLESIEGREVIMTGTSGVRGLTVVKIGDDDALRLRQGKIVKLQIDDGLALAVRDDRPVALVECSDGRCKVRRGFPQAQ